MSVVRRLRAVSLVAPLAVASASLMALAIACGSSSSGDSGGSTTDGNDGSAGGTKGTTGGGSDGSSGGTGSGGGGSDGSSVGDDDGGTSMTTATTGCAAYPHAAFCDDFENETDAAFASNWTDVYSNDLQFERPVTIESTSAVSGTHVLHADAELVADAGNAGQRFREINRQLPSVLPGQSITAGFSYRVVSYQDLDGSYVVGPSVDVQIVLDPTNAVGNTSTCLVQLQGKDATHMIANVCGVQAADHGPTVTIPFAAGTWQRVEVRADYVATDAGAGTVSLIIDGTTVASEPVPTGPSNPTKPSTYGGAMTIGAFADSEVPSSVIDIDDVVITQD